MPQGILPDEGIGQQLVYLLKATIAGAPDWQLRLWVNNIVPTRATVLADLVEATFNGYVRKVLMRANWTDPVVTAACATSTYTTTPQSWNVNAATTEKVYGFALVDSLAGVIRFVQRLEPADIQPLALGNVLKLLPQYTLTSCACPA